MEECGKFKHLSRTIEAYWTFQSHTHRKKSSQYQSGLFFPVSASSTNNAALSSAKFCCKINTNAKMTKESTLAAVSVWSVLCTRSIVTSPTSVVVLSKFPHSAWCVRHHQCWRAEVIYEVSISYPGGRPSMSLKGFKDDTLRMWTDSSKWIICAAQSTLQRLTFFRIPSVGHGTQVWVCFQR